jgi:hypothetical protein
VRIAPRRAFPRSWLPLPALLPALILPLDASVAAADAEPHHQNFESIGVPAATADEPRLERVSTGRAIDYIEQGAVAWSGERRPTPLKCNVASPGFRPISEPAAGGRRRVSRPTSDTS